MKIAKLIFGLLLFQSLSAYAANREVRGVSHWTDGKGDCGANQGVGYAGNGTGYIADFRINAHFVIEDSAVTFHFIGYNGKEFFGPTTGTVDGSGNFDAKAREEKYDEDYQFQGKVGSEGMSGVFTRRAHYLGAGNSGPRCTATWKVEFQEGAQAPTAPVSDHPTTTARPPIPVAPTPAPKVTPTTPGEHPPYYNPYFWIGMVLATIIAALIYKLKRKPKVKCGCSVALVITGPTQLNLPRCAQPKSWSIKTEDSRRALLDAGDGSPRHYAAEAKVACTGGGQLDIGQILWSVSPKDASNLTITADLKAIQRCPEQADLPLTVTQHLEVKLFLVPCCGPDITDGYIASINRIYHKLAKDLPLSSTVFMAKWGDRMIYRPHKRGATFNEGCPSPGCNDTVTILDKCYDCFVGDNLLFGIVAGFLGLSLLELEAGGWIAKLVKNPSLAAHIASEELWRKGHDIGSKAKERLGKQQNYDFDRVSLENALRGVPEHEGCRPCKTKGPEPAFIDFSHEPW